MSENSLLPESWTELPETIRLRLGASVGRQRAMFFEEHLLLVVHQLPSPEEERRRGRFFWRKPDHSWFSSDLGNGIEALDKHLLEFEEALNKLDEDEEVAKDSTDFATILTKLTPIHRSVRHLHQVLQDARTLCHDDRTIINYRDKAYQLERTAELLYGSTKNGLDFTVAKRAEEQAVMSYHMAISAHRLNLLAAFFFPLSILSAVFGASYKEVLEKKISSFFFFGVLATGLCLGVFITLFMLKPPKKPNKK